MRVVIAGAGRAGMALAVHLARVGHRVTVIDREEASAHLAFERHGLAVLTGDATEPTMLREAEVATAAVVAAMLPRDADNLAVALLAKDFGARRVLVRMRDPSYRRVFLAAGVQEVVSETDVLVGALATAVEHPRVRHSMVLSEGASVAFELLVPAESPVAGRTVKDIAGDPRFPRGAVFAGVADEAGRIVAPRGDSVVRGGGSVLLVSSRDDVGTAIAFLVGETVASSA